MQQIRLGFVLSLIFFVLALPACKEDEEEIINIAWKNNHAKGIIVPLGLLPGDDSVHQLLHIRLENNQINMLGDYSIKDKTVLFQPLVPLSRGYSYEVLYRNKLIGRISVPVDANARTPKLVAVYPSRDTVPENLLKMYFQFSAPMREGEALQHIFLLDEHNNTLNGTFLDLNSELWNEERTVLTLWLDPGRIKRDLIPNRKMGNPLQKGKYYTLIVSDQWKNTEGKTLEQSLSRKLFVGARDDESPQPQTWQLQLPKSATTTPLSIKAGESLDYFLLAETISIADVNNNKVAGTLSIKAKERNIAFTPSQPWKAGRYYLRVSANLEDLAGNNINRPFDRDIIKEREKKETQFFEKELRIE